VEKLLDLLETLDRWIDETPPVDQPSRFGNKAYRTWFAKLEEVGCTHFLARIHESLQVVGDVSVSVCRKQRPWCPQCSLLIEALQLLR